MRDFGPKQMAKRNFIFNTIRGVFQNYGFMPLETPAMENLSVLTGKYGDEGDRLLYKVLNSGDFLSKVNGNDLNQGQGVVLPKIAEKGLKYDLTVPFARYVVMNQHDLPLPFKRYQVQPVWRADRPQKGRYREFYQCDADVVGTTSLICEAEIVMMIRDVFTRLGITDYTIKINHRKILRGITEIIGAQDKETPFLVAIDKLDKIGIEGVKLELSKKGLPQQAIDQAVNIMDLKGSSREKLGELGQLLQESGAGIEGVKEMKEVLSIVEAFDLADDHVQLDVTLARGLSYYTGTIFEVKVNNVDMGSVSGGGRYDDLTGVFGMPGLSGVGFSFGVDRLYDVMEELTLFPGDALEGTQALIVHFDESSRLYGLQVLKALRDSGIASEIYPDLSKPKKQFGYADKKGIPHVVVIGSEEMESGLLTLRNMGSGEENKLGIQAIVERLGKGK